MGKTGAGYFFSFAAALHSERNFLRSLPCSPLASASLEHSSDAALRALVVLAAGASGVWASAGLANSMSDAKTVAIVREEIVMESTSGFAKGGHGYAVMLNRA